MMLIGGFGTAHGQAETTKTEEVSPAGDTTKPGDAGKKGDAGKAGANSTNTTKTEAATKDFLGLKWGFGVGVIGSFGGDDAVEKASIDENKFVRVDEEGDMRPQVFLEMHAFTMNDKAIKWRKYQRWKSATDVEKLTGLPPETQMDKIPDPPLMGIGPFIAVQSGADKTINALTVGFMLGARKDPEQSTSVNIGIGLSFDPSVQVLGGGMKEGQATAEKAVRFKKEGRFGWALMTSFTF